MSCEFVSELRRLSKLSAEAVQNIDRFDPLKEYMHITRNTETDFRSLLSKISGVHHKQLVLVCGSAGDGKSHLLSYLKCSDPNGVLDEYVIINDATESDAPNQTAIETLSERISAFRDDRLDDGGCEKVVLAINLGMLNNFIDSDQGTHFCKLRQYVLDNNIFSVAQPLPFDKDNVFQHIDFSDYQLYTLTADGAKSDYLTELFAKVFGSDPRNPFYNTYANQGSVCPHHAQCPIRHNFEFLMKEEVQKLLIQRIIEVCIKNKMVVTSRDVLNFIFDAVVSPNFDEKKFWNGSPMEYSFHQDQRLFIRNGGTTKAKLREKHILIYNPDKKETITLSVPFNIVVRKDLIVVKDPAIATNSGDSKELQLQIQTDGSVRDDIVDRLTSANLLPYIKNDQQMIYEVVEQHESPEWRYYTPIDGDRYNGIRDKH